MEFKSDAKASVKPYYNRMWGSGRPPALGAGYIVQRRFESCHPDKFNSFISDYDIIILWLKD